MLRWARNRRSRPTLTADELRAAWQAISLLLEYPAADHPERLDLIERVLPKVAPEVGSLLQQHVEAARAVPLSELQADYVDTFDVTRKCCLHLTYYTHGDTRRRGVALIEFKQAYRRAGVQLGDDSAELPDYLPVVLEFGAFADQDAAWKLLNDHRVGIELLRRALQRRDSRWLPVVDALRRTLPHLDDDDHDALARLMAQGPPSEDVGLDTSPYALDPRLNPKPEPYQLGATIPVGVPR